MIFKCSNASLHGISNDMVNGGQNGEKLHSKTEHTAAIYGNFCPLKIFVARVNFLSLFDFKLWRHKQGHKISQSKISLLISLP